MFNVPILIPAAYNAGCSKVYRLQTGVRGGRKWVLDNTIYTAGVYLPDARFDSGEWKITQWVNGWARIIHHFTVNADGSVIDHLNSSID